MCQTELSRVAKEREAGRSTPRSTPVPQPRLSARQIKNGEVVKDGFVGPLVGWVSRQAGGLVGGRSEAGRSGGEAQMGEDLPDSSWRRSSGFCIRARPMASICERDSMQHGACASLYFFARSEGWRRFWRAV